MKKSTQPFLILLLVFFTSIVFSQDISQLQNADVNAMSDTQIESYWSQIKKGGYTMAQVELLGKAQGIPATKIAAFKRRVNNLATSSIAADEIVTNTADNNTSLAFGLKANDMPNDDSAKELLFGLDFFSNSKVSFAPSVNMAVPKNYQIGPGDEIMIDLWGASEITYKATVNNSGSIKISGIGFIFINGFTLENASKKIISKLKSKHAGISADSSSYNKINTNITVSKIRTVQVNIIGEVKTPGTYALNSLSTVLNALYVAGGPTKRGTFRDVQLIRANKQVASLDVYEYILFGTQKGNLKLQDQDVLLVKPYQNLVAVSGAVKRPGVYELKEGQTLEALAAYFGGFASKAYTNLLMVERFNGTQKEIREVSFKDAKDFVMQSGDKLVVREILNTFENKVSLQGEVYRPGDFELLEKMSLKDLLEKAEGVTPDAFLTRGLLVRTENAADKENIAFSVAAILNGTKNILLNARDEVRIFNKKELREASTITIGGAVNTPKKIEFIENLQIEDVIAMSGGLQAAADPKVINVSRRLKDGSFFTLSQVFTISSEKNLALNNGVPFYLKPFDMVNIRYAKGYRAQQSVLVSGEVSFKGSYVLKNKNERISDILKRAGGFTAFAFVEGATLIREKRTNISKELIANIVEVEDLEAGAILAGSKKFKVGIDLALILKNKGTSMDLLLKPGDELRIPSRIQTIEVLGSVLKPSLVPYQKGQSLKRYVEKSGGFGDTAKRTKIYVSYSNGDIKTVKNFIFFKSYPKLEPGATIFVPAKPVKEKMSTAEIMGITTSIATLGILIQTILN